MNTPTQRALFRVYDAVYRLCLLPFWPLNRVLAWRLKDRRLENSVLHVCYMVHIPYYDVLELRKFGMRADYLAIGTSDVWHKCDYQMLNSRVPMIQAVREFLTFWRIVARYETVHFHFMHTVSISGWELPILKKMGRTIVAFFAGCEARDREKNMALHPQVNICQDCDYNASICRSPLNQRRRRLAKRYGDLTLVSTPDLRDFVPEGIHIPFFAPDEEQTGSHDGANTNTKRAGKVTGRFKIVHATNHPGIEGTANIRSAIDELCADGYPLDFVFLQGVPYQRVIAELADADLAIGKMKMGYYANMQIEAMVMGVPTVTYVRPEFMTDALRDSGFIFATLNNLKSTLKTYLDDPDALAAKRLRARPSILELHDNTTTAQTLTSLYRECRASTRNHSAFGRHSMSKRREI